MIQDTFPYTDLLIQNQLEQKNYSKSYRECDPRTYPLHFHQEWELEFFLKGEGYQLLNGVRHPIKRGTFYLICPADIHNQILTKPSHYYNLMFYSCLFPEDFLNRFLMQEHCLYTQLNENEIKQVQTIFELISQADASDHPLRNNMVSALVEYLMCFLLSTETTAATSPMDTLKNKQGMKQALAYAHTHMKDPIKLQDVAQYAGFSVNYFSRVFHSFSGIAFSEYLNTVPLQQAKKLLLATNMNVTEIGLECGFNTLTHFLRQFKKKYQMTPLQMRKSQLK